MCIPYPNFQRLLWILRKMFQSCLKVMIVIQTVQTRLVQCLITKWWWIEPGLVHLDNNEDEVKWPSAPTNNTLKLWTRPIKFIRKIDSRLFCWNLHCWNTLMMLKFGCFGNAWQCHKNIDFLVGHVKNYKNFFHGHHYFFSRHKHVYKVKNKTKK
jgi:hypothetical protein